MATETHMDKQQAKEQYAKYSGLANVDTLAALGIDIVVGKREGAYVYDLDGNAYLDCHCSAGQNVIGHRHPDMVQALRDAAKECDLGNFPMISKQKGALAHLLADTAPGDLKCTVYGVGRAESVDFSMKLVRGATGRKEIISFTGASHGQTGFALSSSDDETRHKMFGPMIPHLRRIPLDSDAVKQNVTSKTAAVIIEPIQSDAGVLTPPAGLLAEARKACDRAGAALIFDEGRTAFGRTGKIFALEHTGVVPDVLILSKAMGGTVFPITAAVFTPKLNRFMLSHPLIHLSTFGGADIGCLVAIAAINHIKSNRLWENSASRGAELLSTLNEIAASHPSSFKAARGAGLLCALEASSADTAAGYSRALAANGVIALPASANPAAVRFTPPIDVTADEIAAISSAARKAAGELK